MTTAVYKIFPFKHMNFQWHRIIVYANPKTIIANKLLHLFKMHKYILGTWIAIEIYSLHHDPLVWNDPEVSAVPLYVL